MTRRTTLMYNYLLKLVSQNYFRVEDNIENTMAPSLFFNVQKGKIV